MQESTSSASGFEIKNALRHLIRSLQRFEIGEISDLIEHRIRYLIAKVDIGLADHFLRLVGGRGNQRSGGINLLDGCLDSLRGLGGQQYAILYKAISIYVGNIIRIILNFFRKRLQTGQG